MRIVRHLLAALTLVSGLLVLPTPSPPASADPYFVVGEMEDLGGLAPGASGRAFDVNESGVIVGESNNRAFRYDPVTGDMDDISPSPASPYMRATSINEAGTIVGFTDDNTSIVNSILPDDLVSDGSFVYDPVADESTPLPVSTATAVNDSGIVSALQLGTLRAAWHDLTSGTTTTIPLPAGSTPIGEGGYTSSHAADVNSSGVVAGTAFYSIPFLGGLSNGFTFNTSPPGGPSRISGNIHREAVTAINDEGDVASAVWTPLLSGGLLGPSAVVYTSSVGIIPIPGLGDDPDTGNDHTIPHDINNDGLVVGESRTTGGQIHAFLYNPLLQQTIDLGTLGGASSRAFAISDDGVIVGEAQDASGVTRPFRVQVRDATTVHGTIRGPAGEELPGLIVQLYRPTDTWVGSYATTTPCVVPGFDFCPNGDSYFVFTDVEPGTYLVRYVPPAGSGLRPQWHDGAATRTTATPIVVGPGGTVTIDRQLIGGGSVSGTVTLAGGAPAAGIKVQAYRSTDTWVGSYATTTGADGTYTLNVTEGDYKIYFTPPADSGLQREWYDDAPTRAQATTVTVTAGPVTGIDAQLD